MCQEKSVVCTPAYTFNNSFYAAKSLASMPENNFNNSFYTAKTMACMPYNTFNIFYTNSPLATIILIMYIRSLANWQTIIIQFSLLKVTLSQLIKYILYHRNFITLNIRRYALWGCESLRYPITPAIPGRVWWGTMQRFLLKARQKVTWPACQKIRSLIIPWPACQ